MKAFWINTALVLGVLLVGCNAEPAANVAKNPGQTSAPAPVVATEAADSELMSVPLEEMEEGVTSFSRSTRESKDQSGLGGKALQENINGPVPSSLSAPESEALGLEFDSYAEEAPQSGQPGAAGDGGYGGRDKASSAMKGKESSVHDYIEPMEGYGEKAEAAKPAPIADAPMAPQSSVQGLEKNRKLRSRASDLAASSGSNEAKKMPAQPGRVQQNDELQVLPEIRLRRAKDQREAGKGQGPGEGGDKFEKIEENDFIAVADQPLSTFSIDVDTASYSKVRNYLTQFNELPPRDAVRIEELVNYFKYDYEGPTDEHPFAANVEVASCPWNSDNRLVRVGIKGKEINTDERPASNLVFLLDVSGSMNNSNKLPLLKKGMKMLVDQLTENDKISIVVYAGAAGLVLEPTYGYEKAKILKALDRLQAGGSTNGGQGIALAYKTATENFIQGGTNRLILCTDGDFNVGTTSTSDLVRLAETHAKKNIYLSVMGFGIGNHNDAMLEQLSNKANGNYAFIDNDKEAKKVLVEQMSGTLLTIAKDVKIQIEFNPTQVAGYRLVGYENRLLAAQDFNDDKKDAGEIGAGHTVTAFYEIVPATNKVVATETKVDDLKYQTERKTTEAADSSELMTLKLRYKQPEEDVSTLMTYAVQDEGQMFNQASGDFQFATAVAMFGLKLRASKFQDETNLMEIEELVASNIDGPGQSYREEFLTLVQAAQKMAK